MDVFCDSVCYEFGELAVYSVQLVFPHDLLFRLEMYILVCAVRDLFVDVELLSSPSVVVTLGYRYVPSVFSEYEVSFSDLTLTFFVNGDDLCSNGHISFHHGE